MKYTSFFPVNLMMGITLVVTGIFLYKGFQNYTQSKTR